MLVRLARSVVWCAGNGGGSGSKSGPSASREAARTRAVRVPGATGHRREARRSGPIGTRARASGVEKLKNDPDPEVRFTARDMARHTTCDRGWMPNTRYGSAPQSNRYSGDNSLCCPWRGGQEALRHPESLPRGATQVYSNGSRPRLVKPRASCARAVTRASITKEDGNAVPTKPVLYDEKTETSVTGEPPFASSLPDQRSRCLLADQAMTSACLVLKARCTNS